MEYLLAFLANFWSQPMSRQNLHDKKAAIFVVEGGQIRREGVLETCDVDEVGGGALIFINEGFVYLG
jgi:hypothetical protein